MHFSANRVNYRQPTLLLCISPSLIPSAFVIKGTCLVPAFDFEWIRRHCHLLLLRRGAIVQQVKIQKPEILEVELLLEAET